MKYLVRSIKYFLYLTLILVIVLFVLVKLDFVDGDINTMFRNGYKSLWQIGGMLLIFGAIYPKFGFGTRKAIMPGSTQELRPHILSVMESHKYKLEKEDGENMTFRLRSPLSRLLKMTEDRITMTRTVSGYELEGLTKDVVRLLAALERTPDQM